MVMDGDGTMVVVVSLLLNGNRMRECGLCYAYAIKGNGREEVG